MVVDLVLKATDYVACSLAIVCIDEFSGLAAAPTLRRGCNGTAVTGCDKELWLA
jgi:hypothetical protein